MAIAILVFFVVIVLFYLIPQMVGAGVLVQPLLGLPHYAGVIIVGAIVITIVATAGMASTTYVQFLKGSLLIVFSLVVVIAVLTRGLTTTPNQGGDVPFHPPATLTAEKADGGLVPEDMAYTHMETVEVRETAFVELSVEGVAS